MKEEIYQVTMDTNNPSADGRGFFSSLAKANKAVEHYRKVTSDSPDYYGETTFRIDVINKLNLTGYELQSIDTIIE